MARTGDGLALMGISPRPMLMARRPMLWSVEVASIHRA